MITTTEETRVALTDYLTEVCKLAEMFPGTTKPDGLDFEIYGRWAEVIRENDDDDDEAYPVLMKVWANLWRVCRCHQLIVLKHDIDELGALISDKLRQRSDLEKREKALVNELGRLSYWERQEKRNEIKQQREEIGRQMKAICDRIALIQELQSRMRQRRDQIVLGLVQTRQMQKFSQTPNFNNVFIKGEQKLERLVRAKKFTDDL